MFYKAFRKEYDRLLKLVFTNFNCKNKQQKYPQWWEETLIFIKLDFILFVPI